MATEGNRQENIEYHRTSVWTLDTKVTRMTASVRKNYLNLHKFVLKVLLTAGKSVTI